MKSVTVQAPAKINLTLNVGPVRDDGYHEIHSVMQTLALHDTLTLVEAQEPNSISMELSGDEAGGVPTDETNLVCRAIRLLLLTAFPFTNHSPGVRIQLDKRIPLQAGLGGGSSDAAAALRGMNSLLKLDLPMQRLHELGASLGSDVNFFLTGGTALSEGRGEQITALPPLQPEWDLVVVKPSVGVSTAQAYAALDAAPDRSPGQGTRGWQSGTIPLHNDFQDTVLLIPEINTAYRFLENAPERSVGLPPLLCGSGSALFCRVPSPEAGQILAQRLRHAGLGKAWVTRTQESLS